MKTFAVVFVNLRLKLLAEQHFPSCFLEAKPCVNQLTYGFIQGTIVAHTNNFTEHNTYVIFRATYVKLQLLLIVSKVYKQTSVKVLLLLLCDL